MPASRSRGDDRRVVRRAPALEDLRAGGGRHAAGGDDVLERERHAGQRAERLAARPARRRPRAAAASAPSVSTCRKACTRSSTAAIRSRWAWATSTADDLAGGDRRAPSSAAVSRGQRRLIGCLLVQDPRHPEAAVLGGRARRPAPRPGSGTGTTTSSRQHVGQRHRVRRRRDVGGGDLADPGDRPAGSRRADRRTRSSSSSVTASRASRARCATSSRVIPTGASDMPASVRRGARPPRPGFRGPERRRRPQPTTASARRADLAGVDLLGPVAGDRRGRAGPRAAPGPRRRSGSPAPTGSGCGTGSRTAGSPGTAGRRRAGSARRVSSTSGSGIGTADISARVYGCSGSA